ncbi:class I SAM-dependent methyltransferase [Candidatus Puniceispirillum sp.]|nr:class I SAM-dependent methyltransferase [Alphaproteobacteria bacterium]MDC1293838.1 class I SAM-dependent methyltransferase [Candidatus Puniceispirillum sp.]
MSTLHKSFLSEVERALDTPKKIERLLSYMNSEAKYQPFVRSIKKLYERLPSSSAAYSEVFLELAEKTIGRETYQTIADGYIAFVMDVNRSQVHYELSGQYANSSYEEVFQSTYDNEEFMKHYHWGVFASTFLWEHHIKITEFFNHTFLPLLSEEKNLRCFDLGAGSGIWSWQLVKHYQEAKVDAVDISKTSVKKLDEMMAHNDMQNRVTANLGDATSWPSSKQILEYDCGISCFLLEHLEQPLKLFENIARLLKPRGVAFVTAALTAAEIDHIYEFKRESEIILMAEQAGLRVIETKSLGPSNYPKDGTFFPRSMALIVSKRGGKIW